MEEIAIHSVHELLPQLDLYDKVTMFRGQGNIKWPLIPSIARIYKHIDRYEDWNVFEEDLIERFQKGAVPYINDKPTNKFEWLIIAQHHGLPTRFLDWTTNPLKGLFFAVENPNDINDGVLWQLNPTGYWDDLSRLEENIDLIGFLGTYIPDHVNKRIIAQESCFTVFPFPSGIRQIEPICDENSYAKGIQDIKKFIVPSDSKGHIRTELRKLGISHQSIYPGLDGIATNIRREFELEW